jgi:hypothetical protein
MLALTLIIMQRHLYETVTTIPVLIPCKPGEKEGEATFLGANPLGEPRPVRAFGEADLAHKSKSHPLKSMTDPEREFITAIWALAQGIEKDDRLAISQARDNLHKALARKENFKPDPQLPEEWALELSFARVGEEDEKYLLSSRLSDALDSVRLVLWWSGKRLTPALYCPEPKSALYTYVLTRVSAGEKFGICPFCGVLFLKQRRDQVYCTLKHREAHRVARWRATNAAKSKKGRKVMFAKRGKAVTHTFRNQSRKRR